MLTLYPWKEELRLSQYSMLRLIRYMLPIAGLSNSTIEGFAKLFI